MKEDIWDRKGDEVVVVPTNLCTKYASICDKNSAIVAVMGAGLALQAARLFPELPELYARKIVCREKDNFVFWYREKQVLLLPTKNDWRQPSNLTFVMSSIIELSRTFDRSNPDINFRVPLLGCGRGGLERDTVESMMRRWLGDRFTLCDLQVENG